MASGTTIRGEIANKVGLSDGYVKLVVKDENTCLHDVYIYEGFIPFAGAADVGAAVELEMDEDGDSHLVEWLAPGPDSEPEKQPA